MEIPQVSVGATSYPLRKDLKGRYIRASQELYIDGVSPYIIGKGKSSEEAKNDFCHQLHSVVQSLIKKRTFEISGRDELVWKMINRTIDITVYRNRTPITVRQFGRVKKVRPYPVEVTWEDGSSERVTIENVDDADYVTYRAGQRFEAVVARDPLTYKLLRVIYIKRCSKPRRLDPEEEATLLAEIGSTNRLHQDADWKP